MKKIIKLFVIIFVIGIFIIGGWFLIYNKAITKNWFASNNQQKEKTLAYKELKKEISQVVAAIQQTPLSSSFLGALSAPSNKNFELLGVSNDITFEQALNMANYVGGLAKIRPAFLLGVLQEELTLEKSEMCYVTDFKDGKGVRLRDGKVLPKTMNPRDIPDFIEITKELGKDPSKTQVTCPMSFGWGGAMGPADFIPSTWMEYKDKIEKITGKPADPWNIQDAFLATGLYLSDSGATSKNKDGEYAAAMIYFSGSPNSPYTFYAKGVLSNADKIQANIDILEENSTDEELKTEIGQMIMIGFRGTEATEDSDIYKTIKDVKVGGVVLFDYDVPDKSYPRNIVSPEQTKKLISDIQNYSDTPLFVAVDAEGGIVDRLNPKYGFSQVVSEQKMGQDKTLDMVKVESEKLAEELKKAGFNMNMAPVVDLNINPKNPVIGALGRSFSSSSDVVVNNAEVFIKNHLADGIITVEKHFPGQGSATTDSHIGVVDVTDTYNKDELSPYAKLNEDGLLNAVMVAHVINKNVDKNYPATMSSAFIDGELRKQVGFNGVVISDDMQMAAITKNYDFGDSIIKFINAGGDMVSVLNNSPNGYDEQLAYKVRDIIFNAVKDKKIDEKRITESYNRIISLKNKFKITNNYKK